MDLKIRESHGIVLISKKRAFSWPSPGCLLGATPDISIYLYIATAAAAVGQTQTTQEGTTTKHIAALPQYSLLGEIILREALFAQKPRRNDSRHGGGWVR